MWVYMHACNYIYIKYYMYTVRLENPLSFLSCTLAYMLEMKSLQLTLLDCDRLQFTSGLSSEIHLLGSPGHGVE